MPKHIRTVSADAFPPLLREIPQPPKQLYLRGTLPDAHIKCLAVVGSRNYSNYGKQVAEHLIAGLRGYNIGIISGLALGIDAIAHQAAIHAGLYTLAIPGSGIDDAAIYPRTHVGLAHRILESGGGLLSEYDPLFKATKWSFPERNRIMAGMSHATLLIEASERSGTLITARLTVDYNRELLVVPGNIFSENSKGAHQFLKLGATPITAPEDIISALNIEPHTSKTTSHSQYTPEEITILEVLREPMDKDTLIRALGLDTTQVNVTLMHMELKGMLTESNGILYKIDNNTF